MAEKNGESRPGLPAILGDKAFDAAERLAALDKWLAGRIEAANSAEQRLGKRLEFMTRAEDGLRAVFESLRKQVGEAFPIIEKLKQAQPAAEAAMGELARVQHNINLALGQARAETEAILQPLPQQIDAEAQRLQATVEQIVNAGTKRIWARMEELEGKAAAFENWLKEQTEQALQQVLSQMQHKAQAAEQDWHGRLNGQIATLEERGKAAAEAMQRKLDGFQKSIDSLSALAERIVRQSEQEAQVSAEGKAQGLRAEIEGKFERLRTELARSSGELGKQAEQTVGEVRIQLRQEMEQAQIELRQATVAMQRQIEDVRASASRQLQQELEAARQTVAQRVEELHSGGRSLAEQVEEELVQRIRTLRPQFNRELESAEKLLGERIARLADELEASIELRETQLAARMEDLRPRAAAVWRAIEAEMAAKSAALEHEANLMTGWLERRMSQRIDELVQRSRRILQRAIAQADLSTGQSAAEQPPLPSDKPKPAGLEVELFVDGRSKRKVGAEPGPAEDQPNAASAA